MGVGGGGRGLGGVQGVGVERWAVRGREGGVHKGAPCNTATLGEMLPYPEMGVWGGAATHYVHGVLIAGELA